VTISAQQKSFLAEILEDRPIPEATLIYFRERFRDKLHSAILEAFLTRAQEKNLKQQDLAARIHRTKGQISRWFNTPSNLTLDSISDLMVGLGMDFDNFPYTPIENTLAPKAEAAEGRTEKTAPLVSKLFVDTNLIPASKLNDLDAWIKILESWPTSRSVGTSSELADSMQPKPQGAKVVNLFKNRQEPLGQNRNAFQQTGERNAKQKRA
jgi:transcriptional regulator with XRE-family HTH domain